MTAYDLMMFLVKLLSGTGTFLIGVHVLTENIEQLATTKIKDIFGKTKNNKILNVSIGALTTAIIQSSGVTTVLIIGFVNIGVINLKQAAAMIMGANIGTTITAQIASLSAFPITTYIQTLTFIGMMVAMLTNKDSIKKTGLITSGLGLIFIGLSLMSKSMEDYKDTIKVILETVSNPLLLFAIGIFVTALVQSSSATTSIIISMSVAGLTIGKGNNEILYIILGTNIGSCITALISSIDAGKNAKRASLIHLLFNTFGAAIFIILFIIFPDFMNVTFRAWFKEAATQIAMFHTFFNVTCTIIFLPFSNLFVKISEYLIKDDQVTPSISYLDDRLCKQPMLAINQLYKECMLMLEQAMETFKLSFTSFINKDSGTSQDITNNIDKINLHSKDIVDYLIKVSSNTNMKDDEKLISEIHENVGDIIRIADISDNFRKYTKKEVEDNIKFSDDLIDELNNMYEEITCMHKLTSDVILNKNISSLTKLDEMEESVDSMRNKLIKDHIARLNAGKCKSENSGIFINLVSNMERLADHLTYIAHSISI